MRHIPEQLVKPLERILDECEKELRAKRRRTHAEEMKLYYIGMVQLYLSKKVKSQKKR
ncbi:MAG: hypothetical protein IKO26_07915 [Paludibacteraceae bacterium]|nr:hypothetical protein [Paludibacteraceae bacterium]